MVLHTTDTMAQTSALFGWGGQQGGEIFDTWVGFLSGDISYQ
jgi:hypothetical protein